VQPIQAIQQPEIEQTTEPLLTTWRSNELPRVGRYEMLANQLFIARSTQFSNVRLNDGRTVNMDISHNFTGTNVLYFIQSEGNQIRIGVGTSNTNFVSTTIPLYTATEITFDIPTEQRRMPSDWTPIIWGETLSAPTHTVRVRFYTLARVYFETEVMQPLSADVGIQPMMIGAVFAVVAVVVGIIATALVAYNAYISAVPPSSVRNLESMNALVRSTLTLQVTAQDMTTGNFGRNIPLGLYDRPAYRNVPGWGFNGWTYNSLSSIWYADYDIPNISVRYYSSNGVHVTTKELEPTFAPVSALHEHTGGFRDRFWNGLRQIFINWNLRGAQDDAYASHLFEHAISEFSRIHVPGQTEIWFVMAHPDLHVPEAWGLFRSSGARVHSTLFGYASGSPGNFNYLMFADFRGLNAWNAQWLIIVDFDTPWDRTVAFISGIWNWLWQDGGVWWILGAFVLSVAVIAVIVIAIKTGGQSLVPMGKAIMGVIYVILFPFTLTYLIFKKGVQTT